ncbi:MAG TPA: sensor domain-containing diguanylate cyclase [Solirubrobacteraceae bacterium]|nr:sensor domain-containing diguanylate cyclase [Solirubrobacteraceae bacterium]
MPHAALSGGPQSGRHFSCSMTALVIQRVRDHAGPEAVAELLARAGAEHDVQFLSDLSNWTSFDEAMALLRTGALITHHPQFARATGEDAARRLNASPVAALFRSLGSPEEVYRHIAQSATKYSVVSRMQATAVGPGFAEIVATPAEGFARDPSHCAWTTGMLTQPTILFGLPKATVTHECCAAYGADACRYTVTWERRSEREDSAENEIGAVRAQLAALQQRLHGIFQTAGELIAADEIEEALARIVDRAGVEVRAQRYLLAVRLDDGRAPLCHHRGFGEQEAASTADLILGAHPATLPANWLVVPVRSGRRDYGRLLALQEPGREFFAQERELLEVYATYAASVLDSATALAQAERRYEQSSALLALARALAVAGTSEEVAAQLATVVPDVVDCDRAAVYLWRPEAGELVRAARTGAHEVSEGAEWRYRPEPGGLLAGLLAHPDPEPIFIDMAHGEPGAQAMFAGIGAVATIIVPLVTAGSYLGSLAVSVMDDAERLAPSTDLLDRLSGVAAQATTALQNGRLVDQITHQARHDDLTGLANRPQFRHALGAALARAREDGEQLALLFVDLDGFKPINDRLGHETGDRLLIAVAERMRDCIRPGDLVARLGGDEFAVLIGAPQAGDAALGLEARLDDAFRSPLAVAGTSLTVGASVGHAIFPGDATDAEALIRHADAAMFAHKRDRARSRLSVLAASS